METLKQKQLRILNETAAAYTSENRSIDDDGCHYYTPTTQGCGVGRLIADKELCKKLDSDFDGLGNGVPLKDVRTLFNRLPDDIKELGVEFLHEIQGLHDDNIDLYWNENGITEKGLLKVEEIKVKFELNEN